MSIALPAPATSADDVYHIYLMRYARARDRRAHGNFMIADMHDAPMPVDYNLWIVVNASRVILVDTGFSAATAARRARILDFDPVEGLSRLGLPPESIETVVLTHLHFDHAGNIDRFPRAHFHVQDAEVTFATGRCMCHARLRHPFEVEDVVTLVRHTHAGRVTFHDGDSAPFPGVTLHHLPGHSKGVQSLRVNTPRGPVLLASDASHFYAMMLRGAPSIVTVDAVATMRSYRRMMELVGGDVQRIIPGHDPKVQRYYPRVTIGGVELLALHERPAPHCAGDLARLDDF